MAATDAPVSLPLFLILLRLHPLIFITQSVSCFLLLLLLCATAGAMINRLACDIIPPSVRPLPFLLMSLLLLLLILPLGFPDVSSSLSSFLIFIEINKNIQYYIYYRPKERDRKNWEIMTSSSSGPLFSTLQFTFSYLLSSAVDRLGCCLHRRFVHQLLTDKTCNALGHLLWCLRHPFFVSFLFFFFFFTVDAFYFGISFPSLCSSLFLFLCSNDVERFRIEAGGCIKVQQNRRLSGKRSM